MTMATNYFNANLAPWFIRYPTKHDGTLGCTFDHTHDAKGCKAENGVGVRNASVAWDGHSACEEHLQLIGRAR